MIDPYLGYDPRPDVVRWRGTPIPPIKNPLPLTPARAALADRVWWNGPPWTVLRNADVFLWHVMDYGTLRDIAAVRAELADELWLDALQSARPGDLSRGSYLLWSRMYRRWNGVRFEQEARCPEWDRLAHRLDWKPLAGASRQDLYRRAAWHQLRALGVPESEIRRRIAALDARDWRWGGAGS